MNAEKSFSGKDRFFLFICALGMVLVSAYLTFHFFEVKSSSGLESGSICNISEYFNCSKAVNSDLSSIFGVPISLLGLIMGFFSLGLVAVSKPGYRATLSSLITLNLVLCSGLFFYSLIVLQGFCPLCCLYYVFSTGLFTILRVRKWPHGFDWKVLLSMAAVTLVVSVITWGQTQRMDQGKAHDGDASVVQQFASQPSTYPPTAPSGYKLVSTPQAPIHLLVFSDFECPACKMFSQMLPQIEERYKGKIDIEYYFFPLDPSCNSAMDHALHPFACKAALIAACDPQHFAQIHDELFQNQDHFSDAWLDQFAKSHGLSSCAKSKDTLANVQGIIQSSLPVGISSTPTLLLNGKKISGVLPIERLFLIMDSLISAQGSSSQ